MYHKTTLANGLRVLSSTMPQTQSVSICIFVGIGSRFETDDEAGASHFIEHVLFRGTDKRPTSQVISEAIEGLGGVLNGGTDRENTVYWVKVAKSHFRDAFDVLADMLLRAKFDAADVEKERSVIIEEINMTNDNPSSKVGYMIDSILWPHHPLGRDIAGTKETVSSISRDSLRSYQNRTYLPENTVISIAGGVSHEEAVQAVQDLLGSWHSLGGLPGFLPYKETVGSRLLVEKRDIEQVNLCLAVPGVSITDDRRFAWGLLNAILGEGMSSRLFTRIRDRFGLAYSIYSYVDALRDAGSLTVAAGVDPKNLEKAVSAVINELELLKDSITDAEITKAKEMSKGRMILRLEDSRAVASFLGSQETLTENILTLDQVIEKIDTVTAEDLARVAADFICLDKTYLAVIGPVKKEASLRSALNIAS